MRVHSVVIAGGGKVIHTTSLCCSEIRLGEQKVNCMFGESNVSAANEEHFSYFAD
jgi:hypothetical protein